MSSLPSYAFVAPNYNHERFLPILLQALEHQTAPPQEICIVDDCSTDGSRSILRQFAARNPALVVLENAQNMGPDLSTLRAVQMVKSDYIFYGAADDIPEPTMFQRMLELAVRYPQCEVITTNFYYQMYEADGSPGRRVPSGVGLGAKGYFSPEELASVLRRLRVPAVGPSMLKRSAALGEWKSGFEWWNDYTLNVRLGFRHGLCHSHEPLFRFHLASDTWGSAGRNDRSRDRAMIARVLRAVEEDEFFAETRELYRRSGFFSLLGHRLLETLLVNPSLWKYGRPALSFQCLFLALNHYARVAASRLRRIGR